MSISTQIAIPAHAEDVWAALTDLASYPAWNPFVRRIEGDLADGARWKAELTIDGRLFFTVPTLITHFVPGRRLIWSGGIPGVMTGSHGFSLIEAQDGTLFEQTESFSGRIVPVALPLLRRALTRRFVEMNGALKAEVLRRRAA